MNTENNINLELRKFVAPEFIFGIGARKLAGQYAENLYARKVLIVTDPGIVAAGWTKDVAASLDEKHLPWVIYSGVTPNPRAEESMAGAELYQREGCNVIVAIGGGSTIDCAKGIGIVCTNKRHILEFEGIDQVRVPIPPLICIPTTGGTSADVSQFAIITDLEERVKIAIISKTVVPDVSLIDPAVLTTMDRHLTACTGMDALVHAIEAFVSNASTPFTDIHALEAIRVISRNLINSVNDLQNVDLRGQIMRGSLEAGLAFSNASLGGVHAMAHSLGGFRDLPHGECNAMLLRHVMDFNFPKAPGQYERIGEAMGLKLGGMVAKNKRKAILDEITRLAKAVGIVETLGKRKVVSSDVFQLAETSMKDPCIVTNPRKPNKRDIEVIYEEAI